MSIKPSVYIIWEMSWAAHMCLYHKWRYGLKKCFPPVSDPGKTPIRTPDFSCYITAMRTEDSKTSSRAQLSGAGVGLNLQPSDQWSLSYTVMCTITFLYRGPILPFIPFKPMTCLIRHYRVCVCVCLIMPNAFFLPHICIYFFYSI